MNGAPRFHLCMSGDPSCSGCNPCEPCAEFVSKTVNGPLLSAMVAAGFNGSYEQSMAFFRGYTEGWQRLGHAMAVDPNIRSRLRATNVGAMIDSLAALGQMGGAPGQQALPFSPGVVQPPAIFGMPQPQPQFGPPPGFGAPQGLPQGFSRCRRRSLLNRWSPGRTASLLSRRGSPTVASARSTRRRAPRDHRTCRARGGRRRGCPRLLRRRVRVFRRRPQGRSRTLQSYLLRGSPRPSRRLPRQRARKT